MQISGCRQAVNNRLFNLLIGLSRAAENKNKKDTLDLNATIELSCTRFKYEWQVIKRGFTFKARVHYQSTTQTNRQNCC